MANVLLLCGSLRANSLNHLLLEAAAAAAPPGVHCVHDDTLGHLPLYDQDLDTPEPPPAVARLRAALSRADGVFVASPEYNHTVPGALKNAIDWASRPHGRGSLRGKAVAVAVVTAGAGYGFQGSAHLRALLADLGNFVVHTPLLVVQRGGQVLRRDDAGGPVYDDEVGRRLLAANWAALAAAMAANAGALCLAGARALAASAPA